MRHVFKLKSVKPVVIIALLAFGPLLAKAEDWKTTDGMVYQNVQVVKVEDDAVTILYKDGGALVPLEKLPPPIQERFDYDPKKAKAAADARAKQEAADAKALQAEIDMADKLKKQQQINYADAKSGNSTATTGTTK
jgi:hypothetical protein